MKKLLSAILAVAMLLSLSFGAIASEADASFDAKLNELAAALQSFEKAHPEMKETFHTIIQDVAGIAAEEFREAFVQIQTRFGQILEEDRQKQNITDEEHEKKKETLEAQAALINAGFIAHLKISEERMIATLRGTEYEGAADVISTLERLVSEKMIVSDEKASALKAGIEKVLEKVKSEYNGDLEAWYREVSARPELPEGDAGKPDDETRPPRPEGEKPEGNMPEGNTPPDGEAPKAAYNDHFTIIRDELEAASDRIDERIQALTKEAPEKYQIAENDAAEAFDLLNRMFKLVNEQMMEKLRSLDRETLNNLPEP